MPYSPEEEDSQQKEIDRYEKDRVFKEYFTPAALEIRNIEKHAEIKNDYNANIYRNNVIAKAKNKVREAALANDEIYGQYKNISDYKKGLECSI